MNHTEKAMELFSRGFVCSQAVLGAFCETMGLDERQALKIANGFGGGIARSQQICGAVSGAVMVIGLKYGRADIQNTAAHEETYRKIDNFCERFKELNGSCNCRELLGCSLAEAREKGYFSTLCLKYVQDAARLLENLLKED